MASSSLQKFCGVQVLLKKYQDAVEEDGTPGKSSPRLYLQMNDLNVLCRVTVRMLRQQLVNVTQRIQLDESQNRARAEQTCQG